MDSQNWTEIQEVVRLLDEWFHTIRKYSPYWGIYSDEYLEEEKGHIENISFKLKELYDGFISIGYNPRVHALIIRFDDISMARKIAQQTIDISDNFNFFDDLETPIGATILMQSIRKDGFYNI